MKNLPSCPKVVFFDWDGTLVDTAAQGYKIISEVMRQLGHNFITFEAYLDSPSLSLKDYFSQIFLPSEWKKGVDLFYQIARESRLDGLSFFSQSPSILELLQKNNIPMGIVSNKESFFLNLEVDHFGWRHFFKVVVGSGEAKEDKPSAAPLLYALEKASLKPGSDVWFVGDSQVDMSCAHKAGCYPVSVGLHASLYQEAPILQANNCAEFYAMLVEIFEKNSQNEKTNCS